MTPKPPSPARSAGKTKSMKAWGVGVRALGIDVCLSPIFRTRELVQEYLHDNGLTEYHAVRVLITPAPAPKRRRKP